MPDLTVRIKCPAAVAVNTSFANGFSVQCNPGQEIDYEMTNDQFGQVYADFVGAQRQGQRDCALARGVGAPGCGVFGIRPKDYGTPPKDSTRYKQLMEQANGDAKKFKALCQR